MSDAAKVEKKKRLKELLLQRIEESRNFDLSSAQKRFLYVSKIDEHVAAYNLPVALKYFGDLDASVFEDSIKNVISRHEILSTRLVPGKVGYSQVTNPWLPLDYQFVDLYSNKESPPNQKDIDGWISNQVEIPFCFENDSLIRFRLLRTDKHEYLFLLNVHHIIWDDQSLYVFLNELSQTYERKLRDESYSMEKPLVQYYDYVQWELDWQSSERFVKQLEYWKSQLSDAPPFLNLPLDHRRPATTNYSAKNKHTFHVDRFTLSEIDRVCSREGITTLMFLLGAFGILLNIYTNQKDILVGMPVSKRSKNEFEGLIGLFVNTLVIKAGVNKFLTVREYFSNTKDTVLEALRNKMVPFESVVEEISPMRSQNVNPLIQVMFSYYMHNNESCALEGVKSEFVLTPHTISNFDVTQIIHRDDSSLSGVVEYNSDIFDESTIVGFVDLFCSILKKLSHIDFDFKLHELYGGVLNRDHRIVDVDRVDFQLDRSSALVELEFLYQGEAGKIAIREGSESISYRDLERKSNILANYLIDMGVREEVRVAVSMPRSIDLVVSILGVIKAGACFIPIHGDLPAERKKRIISHGKPLLLLHNGDTDIDTVEGVNLSVDYVDNPNESQPRVGRDLNSLVYIIYTSGSTGEPKGVGISAENLLSLNDWHNKEFCVSESSRATFSSSVGFDAFIWEVFPYLAKGAEFHVISNSLKTDVLAFSKWLTNHGISHAFIPTAILERMLALSKGDLTLPDIVLTGGDKLNDSALSHIGKCDSKIYNAYGLTETSVVTTCGLIDSKHFTVTIGKPIDATYAYILDDTLYCKPQGVYGQIAVSGKHLARGYISNPRLTAEKFVPNPYSGIPGDRMLLTGDEGRIVNSGLIEFVGRLDAQVSINGIRVELMEIESAIFEILSVKACTVLALSQLGTARLVAYIIAGQDWEPNAETIRRSLSSILPRYMIPHTFVFLPEFPITTNGKLDRSKLAEMCVENEQEEDGTASELENKIRAVWEEVLQRDGSISLRQNFFELGCNSLQAVEIANAITARLNVQCKVGDILDNPTISDLACFLDSNAASAEKTLISACDRRQRIPLSYTQERLWILDKLSDENNAYGIPICVHIRGAVDIEILMESLDHVIGKHEIFNTAFPQDEQGPYQVVQNECKTDFTIIDLQNVNVPILEWHDNYKKSDIFCRKFDVTQGGLIEIVYIKIKGEESILSVNMHHIITDGWSMNSFISMVFGAYKDLVNGKSLSPDKPKLQYADFSFLQRNNENAITVEDELYWKESLEGQDRYINFPIKPDIGRSIAEKEVRTLGMRASERLDVLCREELITPFMYFLATLAVLLYHYSKKEDMLIYSITANRDHPQLKSILGPFINTLCFHLNPKPGLSFKQYLAEVKKLCLNGFQRQSVPYEKIKSVVKGEGALDGGYGIDVMFVMQNFSQSTEGIAGLEFTELGGHIEGVKYDLDIEVAKGREGYSIQFTYNAGKLERSFITKLLTHYEELLNESFDAASLKLGCLRPICEQEKELITEWNRVDKVSTLEHDSIVYMVNESCKRNVEHTALIHNGDALSYGDFLSKSNQLANYFSSKGITPGLRVGICMDRSPESIITILALFKVGAAYVPLDPSYPASRINYIAADAKLSHAITASAGGAELNLDGVDVITLDDITNKLEEFFTDFKEYSISPLQTAYIIYTSGSTGTPVGVSVSHSALQNHIRWISSEYPFDTDEVACHKTSINFVDSVAEIWSPLSQGVPLLVLGHEDVMDLSRFMARLTQWQVSRIVLVPSLLHAMLQHFEDIQDRLPNLKTIMCGGEEVSPQLARLFFDQLPDVELINIYGASEVASDVSSYVVTELKDNIPDSGDIRTVPIGRAINNCSVKVLDKDLNLCPVGVEGILYASGIPATNYYLDRPSHTAAFFVPDPYSNEPGTRMYCLGDAGRLNNSGDIEYLGRKDHQVKVNGNRINLLEISNHVTQLSFIEKAEVLAKNDERGGTEIICYMVVNEQPLPQEDIKVYIRNHLAHHLPGTMIPGEFNLVADFPALPNGKINKSTLLTRRTKKIPRSIVSTRNKYDKALVEIWLELTGQDSISIDERLFDVGGNSLVLVKFHAKVVAESASSFDGRSSQIKISDYFELLTIRRISDYIQGGDNESVVSDSMASVAKEKRRRLRKSIFQSRNEL